MIASRFMFKRAYRSPGITFMYYPAFTRLLLKSTTVFFLALGSSETWSATITWETANTLAKSQLLEGNVVLAANGGPQITVTNDTRQYRFEGLSYQSLPFSPAANSTIGPRVGSSTTGDANFDDLISTFAYTTTGVTQGIHTLAGLTPGLTYKVQIFYNDQRSVADSRAMIFGNRNEAGPSAEVRAAGAGWGQHAIGTFVADSTVQDIRHATSGFKNVHFTAMLVVEASNSGPTVKIFGDTSTQAKNFELHLSFSEAVVGLIRQDIDITNGEVLAVTGEGRYYRLNVQGDDNGDVNIRVREGAAQSVNSGASSVASDEFTTNNLASNNEQWVIDDQASWLAAELSSDLQINQGLATVPSQSNEAKFISVIQSYPTKRQANHLILEQSPVWDNWRGVANVGPQSARDAPVLISIEDGNYYYLGRGSTNGYHAWHSTDMQSWSDRGPVTPTGDGRWVTSAEYKDGLFYIYADVPNDQTPSLFLDNNLDDGIPGISMGPAFQKPECGSDASFFRNDSDGLFHIIYEDWSPINARQNSWDSPLAGHASSVDGLSGFEHHEHVPVVDHRTTPQGVDITYSHPQIGSCSYELHSPAQDAYGDWTTIKVGGQYYMFADYDLHSSGIRIGRFTSDSINKEFDLVGSLGNGHPDPTVGFAVGQFYLISQQATAYVSPGPWVDGVEARAGVDQDGDRTIDVWTEGQTVQEIYDHKAGDIRVVEKTRAQLDLAGLLTGYGFQFEVRVDPTVVDAVTPVLDRIEMEFNEPDSSGSGTCSSPTNIAAQGTPRQSSGYRGDQFPATNAIDGDLGNFTHTGIGQSNASWQLDFNSDVSINQIELHNRRSCCGSRLRDIEVTVVNASGERVFRSALLNPENSLNSPDAISLDLAGVNGSAVLGNRIVVSRRSDPDHSGGTGGASEADVISLAEVEVLGCQ